MSCPLCGGALDRDAVQIDLASNFANVRGRVLKLQGRQAEVLNALNDAYPKPVSRDKLMLRIYGATQEIESDRILDVYICQLRRLLRGTGAELTTIPHHGWVLVR